MNHSRRPAERRRRVMMTTVAGPLANATAGQKAAQLQWREARRPAVAYGSRVRQCLRGRWFALVPVSRSATGGLLAIVGCLVVVLIGLHYASIAFPAFAERESVTAVTRIDATGSLGRYCTSLLMLGIAGSSWLIYQLRRYRNDDFQGHYRLWRSIVIMALLGSVATVVPMVALLGGMMDWGLGKRVALSGSDWVTLLMTVGGAVLCLRTIAELWRFRISAAWLLAGWLAVMLPVAENWNLFEITTPLRWTAFTSAMLVASTCWFFACVTYLRTLYMDVRGIERPMGWIARVRHTSTEQWESVSIWPKRETRDSEVKSEKGIQRGKPPVKVARPAPDQTDDSQEPNTAVPQSSRLAKLKFWARKPKPSQKTDEPEEQAKAESSPARQDALESEFEDKPAEAKPKRSWFGKRQADAEKAPAEETKPPEPEGTSGKEEEAPRKRRFGLKLPFGRGRQAADDSAEENLTAEPLGVASSNARQADTDNSRENEDDDGYDSDVDGEMNEDDIDWSSMSKAERRRVRKQLKRGGRAA